MPKGKRSDMLHPKPQAIKREQVQISTPPPAVQRKRRKREAPTEAPSPAPRVRMPKGAKVQMYRHVPSPKIGAQLANYVARHKCPLCGMYADVVSRLSVYGKQIPGLDNSPFEPMLKMQGFGGSVVTPQGQTGAMEYQDAPEDADLPYRQLLLHLLTEARFQIAKLFGVVGEREPVELSDEEFDQWLEELREWLSSSPVAVAMVTWLMGLEPDVLAKVSGAVSIDAELAKMSSKHDLWVELEEILGI